MKQIPKNDDFAQMLFITESRCLSKLKHSSIIEFIDMLMDKKYYYLIMEKCDYDLYHIMKRHGHISEKKTKRIMYALLAAIYYLHDKNIAHRDLKPENIVFHDNDNNRPILIDFGDAEICKSNKMYDEFVGTAPYMSPERLVQHNGDELKKADMWALGVIAYEMYSGKKCFDGDTQKQVFNKIKKGEWQWNKDRMPSELMRDFINKCLNLNPQQRISVAEGMEHPWFEEIKEEKEDEKKNQVDYLRFYETSGKIVIFGNDNKVIGIDLTDAKLPGDLIEKRMTILRRNDVGFNKVSKERMTELRDEWITNENNGNGKIIFSISAWAKSDYVRTLKIHGPLHDLCVYCRNNFYEQEWIPHVQIFNKM